MATHLTQLEFDALASGYAKDPCKSWSIGSQCYIEPKYQAIEKEHVFAKSWQFVCHEEAFENTGDYVSQEVAGQPILVVRNAEGGLQAFYNVCKHRGHLLVQGRVIPIKLSVPTIHGLTTLRASCWQHQDLNWCTILTATKFVWIKFKWKFFVT